jgi:hypothetical protein
MNSFAGPGPGTRRRSGSPDVPPVITFTGRDRIDPVGGSCADPDTTYSCVGIC